MTDIVARARSLAQHLHAGDRRKGSDVGYFEGHLEPVARIVAEAGGTDVQVAAAYLHDAAEDHGGLERLEQIAADLGAEVAAIVADLSDSLVDTSGGAPKEAWRPRKERYVSAFADKPRESLEVAAADKLQNASSILADLDRIGDELWARFTTASATDQLWYYRSLVDVLGPRLPDWEPAQRLVAVVDHLAARIEP